MRLHRFYTTETIGLQKKITINSAEMVNQIRRVFRLKSGDMVIIFDGSGSDYECRIADFGKESITLDVDTSSRSRFMPERKITLCAAIVKKDTFEWIVEKATELGVTKIIPIMAERSEKKNLNEMRLNKIAIEASEQSGRGNVPVIHPIMSLTESLGWVNKKSISAVVFHTDGGTSAREYITGEGFSNLQEVFIGPEGGWSPEELELFHKDNIPVVTLGNQVLRAETAVIAALSLVILGK
jgi:16S rRNA (uracil1498-N3)-methyltransferase